MANTNNIGPATKINGSIETEEDLTVEGRIEGGPVRVRGRLHVAARGIVLAEDTEVTEALIVGVFVGTLRASEVVRIHQDGRVVGDVIAPRVVFVSDKPVSGERTRTPAQGSLPPPPPRARLEEPTPEPAPIAAESPAAEAPAPRAIPPLPGLGQRAMQRKD